jgi:hypothetical protein
MGRSGRQVRRGPGPSSTLITPDRAGNVVGVDPHKRTLTATVVDLCGGIVSSEHFRVSGDGHRALEAWAEQFGPVVRWGVEGASGWGAPHRDLPGRPRPGCARRVPEPHRASGSCAPARQVRHA